MPSDPQAKAIFAQFGLWRLITLTLAATPRILRALLAAMLMKSRWPFEPPPAYFSRTLADLRSEH